MNYHQFLISNVAFNTSLYALQRLFYHCATHCYHCSSDTDNSVEISVKCSQQLISYQFLL